MPKEYFVLNEEPNVNILGLDPIILGFHSEEFKKFVGTRLTKTFYKLEDEYFKFGTKTKEWMELSEKLFEKTINDPKFENETVKNIENRSNKIYKLSKETLLRLEKEEISEDERKEIIKKLWEFFVSLCAYGLIAPIVEFGCGGMTKKLEEIIKNKTNAKKVNEYSSLLSFRYEENYDQKGQKALLKITQKIFINENLKNLFTSDKNNREIINQLPNDIQKEINDYIFEWGWLTYSYAGPEYTIENAINDIKGFLTLDSSPEEQAIKINEELKINTQKQKEALKELNLNKDDLYIIKVAQNFTSTKYLRTKMMFLADFAINKLLKTFAQKEGLSMKQIGVCTVNEMLNYFKTNKLPDTNTLNQRLKYSVMFHETKNEQILFGNEAKDWFEKNVKIEEVDKNISEISGQVACVGENSIIKGKVKIINRTKDMKKFNEGDVLVSVATTPDIVPAMKKASAIVTDIGGLTCHAAIVSRELNKTCIIGTKFATKVLKDGQEIKVDAEQGIIIIY